MVVKKAAAKSPEQLLAAGEK